MDGETREINIGGWLCDTLDGDPDRDIVQVAMPDGRMYFFDCRTVAHVKLVPRDAEQVPTTPRGD